MPSWANPPASIGRYKVLRELARGGMGAVYQARSPEGREVAIKVVLKPLAPGVLDRFARERRLLSELGEEQGFVPILDAGEERTGPFLVMPLVTGGTLRARIQRGPFEVNEALALVSKLATAAGRAHALGIVHRDLKPENVLFTDAGVPLLADLGLAKHFRADAPGAGASIALSKTGEFRGTVGYMAPEQTGNAREAGPPADVFALGAILYECLTGQSPFDGVTVNEVLAKVASDTVTSVRNLRPDAPRWLVPVLARALRVDPAKRFPDGASFARALADGPRDGRRRALARLTVALGATAVSVGVGASLALGHNGRARSGEGAPVASGASPLAGSPRPHEPPRGSDKRREPEWYLALPESERPRFPLPAGLSFSATRPGVYVNERDGSELVFVPKGSYTVGVESRASTDNAAPSHPARLSAYFIGRTELTVGKFRRFVEATGKAALAEKTSCLMTFGYDQNAVDNKPVLASFLAPNGTDAALPDEPVAQVNWADADAYCRWAGLALPSEAQWEIAAGWDRAAQKSHDYPWGVDGDATAAVAGEKIRANLLDASFQRAYPFKLGGYPFDDGWVHAAPVGSFPDGVSPSGCLDMCGNVREWVFDFDDPTFYTRSPLNDPVNDREASVAPGAVIMHVVRGGSFASSTQWGSTRHRAAVPVDMRCWDLGFRVARAGY